MQARVLLLSFLIVSSSAACSKTGSGSSSVPTPTPDNPATRAARAEEEFLTSYFDRNGEMRTAARTAVNDFVKSSLPGWTVKGISSQLYEPSTFSMDADLEREGHHVVITFDVRKFFSDSGDSYWLAVPVNKFRLDRLHALTDADLQKQLKDAQSELENAREPPDSVPDEP